MLYRTNHLVLVLVCCFALIGFCGCQNAASQDLDQRLELADSLSRSGNNDSALAVLDKLDQDFPNSYGINTKRGEIHILKGDSISAEKFLIKEATMFPDSVDAHTHLGMFYFFRDNSTKAIESFKTSLQLKPDWRVYSALGRSYLEVNNFEDASISFSDAIKLNDTSASLYYYRGISYLNIGDYSLALEDFLKSQTLDQDDIYIHYQLGNCYQKLENYTEAYKSWQTFFYLRGGDTTGSFALGLTDKNIANGFADKCTGLRLAIYENEISRSTYYSEASQIFSSKFGDDRVAIVFQMPLDPEMVQLQPEDEKFSYSIPLKIDRYTLEIYSKD